MCRKETILFLSCLFPSGLVQAQAPTIPESPIFLESYDMPGYFLTATTSGGAVQMIHRGNQSTAGQWNLLTGLADADAVSFASVAMPDNIMRHSNFVFFAVPRATDTLFLNDATLFPREGLADPTCVSFESHNYTGYYLSRNASFGLALVVPTSDLGAATFRWSSVVRRDLARDPIPGDSAIDVPRDASLGWTPGRYAATHDVYFGTRFDDVNTASRTSPKGVLASQGQAVATFDPAGLLAFGQAYYWRVDEVNGAPDFSVRKGDTWSLTAETYGYPVRPVKATASSSSSSLMGPEKTIDGSGLDSLDQHSTSALEMWQSKKGLSPIWIQYELDGVYKLYQMWVWNSNQAVEPDVGFGAEDVTVETSLDGTTWTTLADVPEFADGTGEPNYTHNTTVDFGGVQAKYVKLTIHSNWADGTKQSGLSEVRFYYIPEKAYQPTPASGGTGVAIDAVLNWRPGREAVKHEVYFGASPNALSLVSTVADHRCPLGPLGLLYGKTYYWKVNEVNEAGHPSPGYPASWAGDVWSFSMSDYFVVDNFEQYTDKCNRIFWAWVDGLGNNGSDDCGVAAASGNGSGSTVGNAKTPFAERTIVHGDAQSMPFFYDNSSVGYSEAVRTFSTAQDWTKGGVKTLVLWFYGNPDNGAGQLYVKINNVKVEYKGNAAAVTTAAWKQWNIDLTSLSGLQSVKTLTVGISGSGKGVLYIDDIELWREAPAVP